MIVVVIPLRSECEGANNCCSSECLKEEEEGADAGTMRVLVSAGVPLLLLLALPLTSAASAGEYLFSLPYYTYTWKIHSRGINRN